MEHIRDPSRAAGSLWWILGGAIAILAILGLLAASLVWLAVLPH